MFEKNTFIDVGAASRARTRRHASCPACIESRVVPTAPPCEQRRRRCRGRRRRKAAPAASSRTAATGVEAQSLTSFESLLQSATTADDVLSLAGQHLGSLTFLHVVLTLRALAKLKTANKMYNVQAFSKVTRLLNEALRVEEDPLPNAIADLVWSLGRLEAVFDDLPAIVRRVAEMIPTRLGAFTVLELANVLWGLAHTLPLLRRLDTSHVRSTAIAVAQASLQRHGHIPTHILSCRLWAVVKLDLPIDTCEALLRRCAEGLLLEGTARSHVEGMQWCPQGLANVAWSAAKVSLCGSLEGYVMAAVVCAAVAKQARVCLESFKPHELSMMAWACATMHGRQEGMEDPPHCDQGQAPLS